MRELAAYLQTPDTLQIAAQLHLNEITTFTQPQDAILPFLSLMIQIPRHVIQLFAMIFGIQWTTLAMLTRVAGSVRNTLLDPLLAQQAPQKPSRPRGGVFHPSEPLLRWRSVRA